MPELTISAEDIEAALHRHVAEYNAEVRAEEVGRIAEVGDGIARVTGLPNCSVNELLEFENGTVGLALNLDEETIGAVVLGSVESLDEGQIVRRPAASSRSLSAMASSAASSTRSATPSTAKGRSSTPRTAASRFRHPAS